MKGYHVTYYSELDSILEIGLIPHRTTEKNFPMAYDNRHNEAVFFMTRKNSSHGWYRTFHPKDCSFDPDSYEAIEDDRGISVIIEFDLPESVCYYPDPYQRDDGCLKNSFCVEEIIRPEWIVDIHDPLEE